MRPGSVAPQPIKHRGVGGVGLVDHDELRYVERADLGEHLAHRRQL